MSLLDLEWGRKHLSWPKWNQYTLLNSPVNSLVQLLYTISMCNLIDIWLLIDIRPRKVLSRLWFKLKYIIKKCAWNTGYRRDSGACENKISVIKKKLRNIYIHIDEVREANNERVATIEGIGLLLSVLVFNVRIYGCGYLHKKKS